MGTHTAIYVHSNDSVPVQKAVAEFLANAFPGEPVMQLSDQPFPPLYGDLFRCGGSSPTVFAIAPCPAGWCTVHFNSFNDVAPLADRLSQVASARVLVLKMQTTACCYYLSIHEGGNRVRAFDYSDGELTLNSGEPFPFEQDILDRDIRESQVEHFCLHLGLPLNTRENFPDAWAIVQLKNQRPPQRTTH